MNSSEKRIAIIGGGISGLSAAQRIKEKNELAEVTLFESSDRLGGVLRTTEQAGFFLEHSADNFIVSDGLPWAGELCEKLNVELQATSEQHRGALILRNRQLHPVPEGLHLLSVTRVLSLLKTPLLSWPGRLRAAAERFIPPRRDTVEESLQGFATRRFGREMFERIVQPLVAGIYTADPKKLSVAAALPQYVAMEKKYGSLAKGAVLSREVRADRGARYSLFRSPVGGVQTLLKALEKELGSIRVRKSTAVRNIRRVGELWQLSDQAGADHEFDSVICSTPAPAAAQLLSSVSPELAAAVNSIEHVTTAVVCLGLHRSQIAHPLNAFGVVIPAVENRRMIAVSFTHVKFPTRAPKDHALLRVFVGGALQPELADLDDDRLLKLVYDELRDLLGVTGEAKVTKIIRWKRTTPQYHLGHLQRVAEIDRIVGRLPGFELAGNAYRGIGIPQCVRSGWEAADRILNAS